MESYKIDLSKYAGKEREVISKAVQEKAFELGYSWDGSVKEVRYAEKPILYFNIDNEITWGNLFDDVGFNDPRKLISVNDFLSLEKEKEYIPWTKDTCPLKFGSELIRKNNPSQHEFVIAYDFQDKNYQVFMIDDWYSFKNLLDNFTLPDGSPCGTVREDK